MTLLSNTTINFNATLGASSVNLTAILDNPPLRRETPGSRVQVNVVSGSGIIRKYIGDTGPNVYTPRIRIVPTNTSDPMVTKVNDMVSTCNAWIAARGFTGTLTVSIDGTTSETVTEVTLDDVTWPDEFFPDACFMELRFIA